MNLSKMHETELAQLTGCRYATLMLLKTKIAKQIPVNKIGRPFKHSSWTMLIATLMKLRLEMSFRALEIMTRIDAATLCRYTRKICALLASFPLNDLSIPRAAHHYLIVDSTCSRVRSTAKVDYSGYKHHRNRKCQVIVDENRRIVSVSDGLHGRVHDKTIWNREFDAVKLLIDKPVLADKAYAGGKGEDAILFRPIKRKEKPYKSEKAATKSFNRELSRWRVKIEHVFAQLKNFRILRGIFPFSPERYGECLKAIAYIYNANRSFS